MTPISATPTPNPGGEGGLASSPDMGPDLPLLSLQLLPRGRVHRLGFETPKQLPAGRRQAQAGLLCPGHARSPGSGVGNGASQRTAAAAA